MDHQAHSYHCDKKFLSLFGVPRYLCLQPFAALLPASGVCPGRPSPVWPWPPLPGQLRLHSSRPSVAPVSVGREGSYMQESLLTRVWAAGRAELMMTWGWFFYFLHFLNRRHPADPSLGLEVVCEVFSFWMQVTNCWFWQGCVRRGSDVKVSALRDKWPCRKISHKTKVTDCCSLCSGFPHTAGREDQHLPAPLLGRGFVCSRGELETALGGICCLIPPKLQLNCGMTVSHHDTEHHSWSSVLVYEMLVTLPAGHQTPPHAVAAPVAGTGQGCSSLPALQKRCEGCYGTQAQAWGAQLWWQRSAQLRRLKNERKEQSLSAVEGWLTPALSMGKRRHPKPLPSTV